MAKLPTAVQGARIVGEKFMHSRRDPEGRMPLMDHLRELRNRVVKIAIAVIAGGVVGLVFFNRIYDFIREPYCRAVTGGCKNGVAGHDLVFNGVMDGFYIHLKVAIVVGLILTCPYWLFQLWAFIAPGLYSREKRWTYVFVGSAVPLFLLGVYFALLAMDRGLHFFISMTPGLALYTADTYIGYYIAMIIGFGLCFEVPLLLVILNVARVVTHERFKKWRRIIIFLTFVAAGIASPSPDPLTMLLLGGIIMALVEAAEVLIYLNDKRYARTHPELYTDLDDTQLAPLDDDVDSGNTVS
jgi:sec-independent protein translocase protein TatC